MNFRVNNYLLASSPYRNNTLNRQHFYTRKTNYFSSDSLSISATARELYASRKPVPNINRMVDKSIDLQKYVNKAKKKNEENIKHVGKKIFAGAVHYTDTVEAMREALREKYSKLVAIAKTHKNPKSYISQKYRQYQKDGTLSKREAEIGYSNEIMMLEEGKVDGVYLGDSLFRNINFDKKAIRRDEVQYKRRVVNKQIENIFKEAGISKEDIGENLSFKVDPYNYQIIVSGVDENIKNRMEKVLNVAKNGKHLYFHISNTASRHGVNSAQLSKEGKMKYRAYHNVLDYTGLKLNELEAKGNTFYTKDNKDLKELMSQAIDNDPMIPLKVKEEYKQIQFDYISQIALRGWENIKDMPLKILYGEKGLVDFKQDIIFDGYTHLLGKYWYSVI